MKIKKMFSVTLALALLLQIFALALPVSAETVDETDTSSTGAATEAIDLKKQIVPQSEVPALIDYSVAVENKYTCRAYHMETDLNQVVFLKADGSYDTYLFSFPVKYVDENGEVRDKAPELTYNASLTAGKYRMTTTSANDNALFCADVASDGLLYTSDALSLTLRPTTAAEHAFALQIALASSDAELQSIGNAVASSLAVIGPVTQAPAGFSAVAQSDFAPSALNEGITSRAARYALSNDAALSVVPSYNGFQVALGLAKNRTQNTYTFALSTGDATLVNQEGTLLLVNDEGDPLGIVGEFVLVDENGTCGTVAPQVTKVIDGEYLLSADLGDDALVATLSVSQYYDYLLDATIYANNTTVYGSSPHLYVGTLSSSSYLARAVIRPHDWYFDRIDYYGYEVQSATLHIRDVMGDDPEVNVDVCAVLGQIWNESNANWDHVYGNVYGVAVDTKTVSPDIGWDASPRYWYQFNITSIVRDWYNRSSTILPSKGVMLKGDDANEDSDIVTEKTFASSQYSTESMRPYIQVSANCFAPVEDGVYYIKSAESGTYLTSPNTSKATSDITLNSKVQGAMYQMWRVVHMANGYYSIRPYHYTPNSLSVLLNYDVQTAKYTYYDNMPDVPSYASWLLVPYSSTSDQFQMELYGVSGMGLSNWNYDVLGADVDLEDLYGESWEYWIFEEIENPPQEVLLYNHTTGQVVSNPSATIQCPDRVYYAGLNLDVSVSFINTISPTACTVASSDTSVITVSKIQNQWRFNSVGAGSAEVTIKWTDSSGSRNAKINLTVLLADGVYYLIDSYFDKTLQVDDDASSQVSGTILELWDFDTGIDQKWRLTYLDNGYYKITAESSGKAITAPAGENSSVTLEDYVGSAAQQWQISKTIFRYVISPRSQPSFYLSSGDGLFTADGYNVEVRSDEHADEWLLVTSVDSTLIGIYESEGGIYRAAAFPELREFFSDIGYQTNYSFEYLTPQEALACMTTSRFLYCHSGGSFDGISLTGGRLTIELLDALPDDALSNCDLVIYMASSVGAGGESADNLAAKTVEKGARTVVAFNGTVERQHVDTWMSVFTDSLYSGYTVEDACMQASVVVSEIGVYQVFGDGTLCVN